MKDILQKFNDKKFFIFTIFLIVLILLFGIFWNVYSYIRIKAMSDIPDLVGEKYDNADALSVFGSFRYVSGAACPSVSSSTLRVAWYWDGSVKTAGTDCGGGKTCVCYYSSN